MKPYNAKEILGPTCRRGAIAVSSAAVSINASWQGNDTTDNIKSGRRASIATPYGQQYEPQHHYKIPSRSSLTTSLKVHRNPQRWSANNSVSGIKTYDNEGVTPGITARSNSRAVDDAANAEEKDDDIYGYGVAIPDCEANQHDADAEAKYGYEEAIPDNEGGKKHSRRASIGGFPFGGQAFEPLGL